MRKLWILKETFLIIMLNACEYFAILKAEIEDKVK